MAGLGQPDPPDPQDPPVPSATLELEAPQDIVVPLESWETQDPEEPRGTEVTKVRLAWVWTALTETRESKDHQACLARAETATPGLPASLACPEMPAFPVPWVLRGPPASATRRPAREPWQEGAGRSPVREAPRT